MRESAAVAWLLAFERLAGCGACPCPDATVCSRCVDGVTERGAATGATLAFASLCGRAKATGAETARAARSRILGALPRI